MSWCCGLDLGQASDYTAFAAVEVTGPALLCRELQRMKLNTPYTEQVDIICRMLVKPPLAGCELVVDHTGVGRAVVDLLHERRPPVVIVPITITAGHDFTNDHRGGYHVPKKELVSALNLAMQTRRLKVSPALPLAETLATELSNFRVKISKANNEQFGSWRDGEHDDLVLAVALSVWWQTARERYLRLQGVYQSRSAAYVPEAKDTRLPPERPAGEAVGGQEGRVAGDVDLPIEPRRSARREALWEPSNDPTPLGLARRLRPEWFEDA